MQASERERLKERHRYSDWAGQTVSPDQTVRKLILTGDDLPGYQLERSERREIAQHPPRVTGFWRRIDADAVVRVDVFECQSVDTAHEYLIEALGEFESAAVGRRTDVTFGDVAFGTDSVALFARGNVVVLVRKATPQTDSVTGIAQTIDAKILGRLREG